MIDPEELKTTIRRNTLLGIWAAEKLGLVGLDADTYVHDLAMGALDAERTDVFSRIRKDFDRAGVVQSDEQILRVMEDFMIQASAQRPSARGDSLDGAAVALKRRLTSR